MILRNRLLRAATGVALLSLTSLLTACGDATGPSSARRSGYITGAASVQPMQSIGTRTGSTTTSPSTTTTKDTSSTGTKSTTTGGTTTNSGYNVTAF